jgi:hypothetical protein
VSVIWKQSFDLDQGGDALLSLQHQGILHVGIDPNGVPCVWFRAPEKEPWVSNVWLFGTGHPMPEDLVLQYLGSFVWRTLVLHAFQQDVKA